MTTNEFIELLKQNDPDGTAEVCINSNSNHFYINVLPAYYDGKLKRFDIDKNNHATKLTIDNSNNRKIVIISHEIEDSFGDYGHWSIPVDCGSKDWVKKVRESSLKNYIEYDEAPCESCKRMDLDNPDKVCMECFPANEFKWYIMQK